MKRRIALLLPLLGAVPCLGGTSEFHISQLRQKAPAETPFPERKYSVTAFSYLFEPAQAPGAPRFQWCFTAGGGASDRVESHSQTSTSYFKPGGFASVGIRLLTAGQLRFGAGLDLRVSLDGKGGSWGDMASDDQTFRTRPWALGLVQYQFLGEGISPLLSLSIGFAPSGEAGSPTRELALSAGVRF